MDPSEKNLSQHRGVSSIEEDLQNFMAQTHEIQETLQRRIKEVHATHAAIIESMEGTPYLRGINFQVLNLNESSKSLTNAHNGVLDLFEKGQLAIAARETELTALQANLRKMRQNLNHPPPPSFQDFVFKLGEKTCEHISKPKNDELYK